MHSIVSNKCLNNILTTFKECYIGIAATYYELNPIQVPNISPIYDFKPISRIGIMFSIRINVHSILQNNIASLLQNQTHIAIYAMPIYHGKKVLTYSNEISEIVLLPATTTKKAYPFKSDWLRKTYSHLTK